MSDIPFSRPVSLRDVPPSGTHVTLTAEPAELAALAALLKLPAVKRLEARFEVKPWARDGLSVTGQVEGVVVQVCGVTLEEFDAAIREDVDERFAPEDHRPRQRDEAPETEHEADLDAPDVLIQGRADLGQLAAEHLALGLDPYPRKPGVDAPEEVAPDAPPATHRPFAGLDVLVAKGKPDKN